MNSSYKESSGIHDLRIVLLGKNGVGKSSTGNMILGRKVFKETTTKMCEIQRGRVEERNISVIDTPGFISNEMTDEDLQNEMMKSLSLSHPGPHVFLLIIRPDTFTERDVGKILKQIHVNFGREAFKFTMVLFTGKHVMSKREWIEFRLERKTRELLSFCEEKCYVINHKSKSDKNQISNLLENMDEIVKKNEREHSTVIYVKEMRRKSQDVKDRRESVKKNIITDESRHERDIIRDDEKSLQIHQTSEEHNVCLISDMRIVLLGKSGAMKSSTANTLLNREAFAVNKRFLSVNETCEKQEAEVCGRNISVVKTPGLFDSSVTEEKLKSEMQKCVEMSAPGPHVFLLVIRLDVRVTDEERNAVRWIQKTFGEDAVKYTIILLTHANTLKSKPLDEYIRESSDLQTLIKSSEDRYHLLNNEDTEDRSQVTQLLEEIEKMVMRNGGKHYTDELFLTFQEKMASETDQKTKENRVKWLKGVLIVLLGALAAAALATHGLQ